MQIKSEIVDGKKRIIINRHASGVDKAKEVVSFIMGPGWKYEDKEENKKAV